MINSKNSIMYTDMIKELENIYFEWQGVMTRFKQNDKVWIGRLEELKSFKKYMDILKYLGRLVIFPDLAIVCRNKECIITGTLKEMSHVLLMLG